MNVSSVYAYVSVLTMTSQSFNMNKIHIFRNVLIIYLSCFTEGVYRISLITVL